MGIPNVVGPLTWGEFEERISADIEDRNRIQQANADDFVSSTTEWVYRGHSDVDWHLETSLDRHLRQFRRPGDKLKLRDYYGLLRRIIPAVNSLTSYDFPELNLGELNLDQHLCPEHYELLSFTRHLGFPSPLLDWTYSQYVAAFFAFRDANPSQDVAVYAFQAWTENGQTHMGPDTRINDCGPYVESHHRHYRQRGTYTLCTVKEEDDISLGDYKNAFVQNPENHGIKKFIIHGNEKEKVLSILFSMNINDYTLFGDDESLMRMLAYKEFREIL